MNRMWVLLSLVLMFAACSVIGSPNQSLIDEGFKGVPESVRVGLYVDKSVSQETADGIMSSIKYEFTQYGLDVKVMWSRPWERKSFTMSEIILDVAQLPLEPDCDKVFVVVGRSAGDYIWGALMLPEVFGAVETVTRTRGYVVGEMGSFNQIFSGGPKSAAIHEFYHLLGCDDFQGGTNCYDRIQFVRTQAQRNRKAGNDFFPTIGQKIDILLTDRAQVDVRLNTAIQHEQKSKGGN